MTAGGGQHHGTLVRFLCCNVSCLNNEIRRKQKPAFDKTSNVGPRNLKRLRIQKILPKLINNDQTGFLKGRFIGENIRLIDSIIHYANTKQIPGLLLFIDFEKAFDSIEWAFIEKTLNYYNFGSSLVAWLAQNTSNMEGFVPSEAILLGIVSESKNLLLHHLMLLARHHIYICKLKETRPIIEMYKQLVHNTLQIENIIAIVSNS